ncbi:hypothetical protein K469DRAFT_767145, partial [Zopfia rhizophila CBS 207.26]
KEKKKGSDSKEELDKKEKKLLKSHILEFLISLLDYYLKDDEYRSVFINTTIVLNINSNYIYMFMISAIVTIVRILVLFIVIRIQKKRVAEITEKKEFTKKNTKDLALGYFNLVKEIAN